MAPDYLASKLMYTREATRAFKPGFSVFNNFKIKIPVLIPVLNFIFE
jgi:hypothetical protein